MPLEDPDSFDIEEEKEGSFVEEDKCLNASAFADDFWVWASWVSDGSISES